MLTLTYGGDDLSEELSIYDTLMKEREHSPELPYSFQNERLAGKEDTLFILLTEGVSFSQKESLALQCSQILQEVTMEDFTLPIPKIRAFLEIYPMRLFFIELRERLWLMLEAEQISAQALHKIGMRLVRNSPKTEEVKLGLVLLGFSAHDLTQQLFKTFGYHSDYTIYVAESLHHSHFNKNDFLFDLAQHTIGYGKLAALFLMKPITDKQRKWVLKSGVRSTFLSNVYVNLALQKADIRHYLEAVTITKENFSEISYLLAYRESKEDEPINDELLQLMEKFVRSREHGRTFIDQAALVIIWLQLIDSWRQDYQYLDDQIEEDAPLEAYWDKRFNQYEDLIRTIEIFLNNEKWRHIATKEMMTPHETDFLIVSVLQFLEMKPSMRSFTPMLMRNPLGLNLLDFFLVQYYSTYFSDVSHYLDQLLNQDLFRSRLQFNEDEETKSQDLLKVNLWLEQFLKGMLKNNRFDEHWCLKTLHFYHPKIRYLSLKALQKYKNKWIGQGKVEKALEELYQLEKNQRNRRLLRLLLGIEGEEDKEQVYLKIANPVKTTTATDKKLMTTYIAGMRYRDLSSVDPIVEKGTIFQLVREANNSFDKFAIAVTLESGYLIGYIPRVDNRVLASLLDNYEVLYAIFKSGDISDNEAEISVMMKKEKPTFPPLKPSRNSKVVQFPKRE